MSDFPHKMCTTSKIIPNSSNLPPKRYREGIARDPKARDILTSFSMEEVWYELEKDFQMVRNSDELLEERQ